MPLKSKDKKPRQATPKSTVCSFCVMVNLSLQTVRRKIDFEEKKCSDTSPKIKAIKAVGQIHLCVTRLACKITHCSVAESSQGNC